MRRSARAHEKPQLLVLPWSGERFAPCELNSTRKIPTALGLTIPPSLPVQADTVRR
jgi:hypothetical protein